MGSEWASGAEVRSSGTSPWETKDPSGPVRGRRRLGWRVKARALVVPLADPANPTHISQEALWFELDCTSVGLRAMESGPALC